MRQELWRIGMEQNKGSSPVDPGAGSTSPLLEQDAAPWELIEAGRYRPRRIRGSHRGRELG
jgi:hypothetical protein